MSETTGHVTLQDDQSLSPRGVGSETVPTEDRGCTGAAGVRPRGPADKIALDAKRSAIASHCVMKSVPLAVLKEWLGHSTIEMTLRYAHLAPEVRSQFIERIAAPRTLKVLEGGQRAEPPQEPAKEVAQKKTPANVS